MSNKTLSINIWIFVILFLFSVVFLTVEYLSPDTTEENKCSYTDLSVLLNDVEGYGVVLAKVCNKEGKGAGKSVLVVGDANGVCRLCYGAMFNVSEGDTLIIKQE